MYRDLYETWVKEIQQKELQALPRDFYTRVAEYINRIQKEGRMLDKKTVKALLIKQELKNAKTLIKKLAQKRYKKILQLVNTGKPIPQDTLTPEEEKVYKEISSSLGSYHKFLKDILRGQVSSIKEEIPPTNMVLRFLQETPAIIGVDMKTYGPFKPEDVAVLPIENANLLIRQGIAKKIELS
jgi:DNA replication factor GINS